MPRCRKKYTETPRYTLEQAREIYRRFLSRGYSPEEAAEFTQAITGIDIDAEEVEAIPVEAAEA
jgi:SOS response regulatory protein OraA/RecX